MAKIGRPTLKTDDVVATICKRISLGESLRSICRDDAMPSLTTVIDWLAEDDEFSLQYAKAREIQSELYADEIIEKTQLCPPISEEIQRLKLEIDTIKWTASKLKPKKYGDATMMKLADNEGEKIEAININFVGSGDKS